MLPSFCPFNYCNQVPNRISVIVYFILGFIVVFILGLCLASDVRPVMRDNLIYDNHNAVDRTIAKGHCLFKISSCTSFPMHDFYRFFFVKSFCWNCSFFELNYALENLQH